MAKILVLGATGMVGHVCRLHLSDTGHDVVSVARSASAEWTALDVESEGSLAGYLRDTRPGVVVNCIGVLIKESQDDPLRAIRLNALLPRLLESLSAQLGFRLVQLSSDCVFSGAHGPYKEDDRRDADEIYGRAKALGEVRNKRDLTIRTSVVGPELKHDGSGLFNWYMSQKGTIRGFTRAMWGGVTTLEFARFIDYWTANPIAGLLHLTNGSPISKHDLLELFGEIWGKRHVTIERDDAKASDRSLVSTRTDCGYVVPSYRDMLQQLRDFMRKHPHLYRHYE